MAIINLLSQQYSVLDSTARDIFKSNQQESTRTKPTTSSVLAMHHSYLFQSLIEIEHITRLASSVDATLKKRAQQPNSPLPPSIGTKVASLLFGMVDTSQTVKLSKIKGLSKEDHHPYFVKFSNARATIPFRSIYDRAKIALTNWERRKRNTKHGLSWRGRVAMITSEDATAWCLVEGGNENNNNHGGNKSVVLMSDHGILDSEDETTSPTKQMAIAKKRMKLVSPDDGTVMDH